VPIAWAPRKNVKRARNLQQGVRFVIRKQKSGAAEERGVEIKVSRPFATRDEISTVKYCVQGFAIERRIRLAGHLNRECGGTGFKSPLRRYVYRSRAMLKGTVPKL
jgi:hypothetical protein